MDSWPAHRPGVCSFRSCVTSSLNKTSPHMYSRHFDFVSLASPACCARAGHTGLLCDGSLVTEAAQPAKEHPSGPGESAGARPCPLTHTVPRKAFPLWHDTHHACPLPPSTILPGAPSPRSPQLPPLGLTDLLLLCGASRLPWLPKTSRKGRKREPDCRPEASLGLCPCWALHCVSPHLPGPLPPQSLPGPVQPREAWTPSIPRNSDSFTSATPTGGLGRLLSPRWAHLRRLESPLAEEAGQCASCGSNSAGAVALGGALAATCGGAQTRHLCWARPAPRRTRVRPLLEPALLASAPGTLAPPAAASPHSPASGPSLPSHSPPPTFPEGVIPTRNCRMVLLLS